MSAGGPGDGSRWPRFEVVLTGSARRPSPGELEAIGQAVEFAFGAPAPAPRAKGRERTGPSLSTWRFAGRWWREGSGANYERCR
ncbi:MAG TPA: hypothetical protein VME46_11400 [Acidimicrobiales bacterium]|nr:hypothetical protein [Acidimicrobiales bacterium]